MGKKNNKKKVVPTITPTEPALDQPQGEPVEEVEEEVEEEKEVVQIETNNEISLPTTINQLESHPPQTLEELIEPESPPQQHMNHSTLTNHLSTFEFPTESPNKHDEKFEIVFGNQNNEVEFQSIPLSNNSNGLEEEEFENEDLIGRMESVDLSAATPQVIIESEGSNTIDDDIQQQLSYNHSNHSLTSTLNASTTTLPDTSSISTTTTSPPSTAPTSSIKVSLPTSTESITPNFDTSSTSPTTTTSEAPSSPSLDIPKIVQPPRRGSTVRQMVVSMTRQRDLPPKSKEEEKRHLKELESMQAASKALELRRKSNLDALAVQKATSLSIAAGTWESYILPNWRSVLRTDPEGISLRKLWWNGTMPTKWRGRVWGMCIGNGLAVNKTNYSILLGKAQKMIEEGRFDGGILRSLEKDVEETLPSLKLFQKNGAMRDDLVDLLLAYSVYEGEPKYPQGLSFTAAMLLLNMSPQDSFLSLINLINKSFLKSFYKNDLEEMEAYYRIFDTLLADNMPSVYANFTKELVKPSLYLFPWLTTLFVRYLPLDLSIRLFDNFLLEGDSFLFRVALSLLQILEPRLFNPALAELDAVFKGTDRGAIAIVRRERGIGGSGEEEIEEVGVEEVYTEMGVKEEVLFRKLEELDWKEETWERLVTRELPEND